MPEDRLAALQSAARACCAAAESSPMAECEAAAAQPQQLSQAILRDANVVSQREGMREGSGQWVVVPAILNTQLNAF